MGGDVSSSTSTASLPLRSLLCRLQRDRGRIKLLSRKHQHSRTRSARAALQDDDYYYIIIIIERRDIQTEDVYLTGRQLVFCLCVMSTGDEEDSVHQHKSNTHTHTSIFLRSLRIWSDDVTILSHHPLCLVQQMREDPIKLWKLCAHLSHSVERHLLVILVISYVEVSGDTQSERTHYTFCVCSGWNKTHLISVFIYN